MIGISRVEVLFLFDGFGLNNGIMIDSNAVTSIFGKTNSVTKLLAEAVKDEAAGKFSMLYWNKKEATSLLQQAGLQLRDNVLQGLLAVIG